MTDKIFFKTYFEELNKLPKFAYNFPFKKVNFSQINPIHYWIFLIFFVFTLVFFLEFKTREG